MDNTLTRAKKLPIIGDAIKGGDKLFKYGKDKAADLADKFKRFIEDIKDPEERKKKLMNAKAEFKKFMQNPLMYTANVAKNIGSKIGKKVTGVKDFVKDTWIYNKLAGTKAGKFIGNAFNKTKEKISSSAIGRWFKDRKDDISSIATYGMTSKKMKYEQRRLELEQENPDFAGLTRKQQNDVLDREFYPERYKNGRKRSIFNRAIRGGLNVGGSTLKGIGSIGRGVRGGIIGAGDAVANKLDYLGPIGKLAGLALKGTTRLTTLPLGIKSALFGGAGNIVKGAGTISKEQDDSGLLGVGNSLSGASKGIGRATGNIKDTLSNKYGLLGGLFGTAIQGAGLVPRLALSATSGLTNAIGATGATISNSLGLAGDDISRRNAAKNAKRDALLAKKEAHKESVKNYRNEVYDNKFKKRMMKRNGWTELDWIEYVKNNNINFKSDKYQEKWDVEEEKREDRRASRSYDKYDQSDKARYAEQVDEKQAEEEKEKKNKLYENIEKLVSVAGIQVKLAEKGNELAQDNVEATSKIKAAGGEGGGFGFVKMLKTGAKFLGGAALAAGSAFGLYKGAKAVKDNVSERFASASTEITGENATTASKAGAILGGSSDNYDANGNLLSADQRKNRRLGLANAGIAATSFSMLGKGLKTGMNLMTKAAADGAQGKGILGIFFKFLDKHIFNPNSKIGKLFGSKLAKLLPNIGKTVKSQLSKLGTKIFGKAAGTVAKIASGVGIAILVAQYVASFLGGYNNTDRYLGIGKGVKPTLGMKLVSGMAALISDICFGLIPIKETVNWLLKAIMSQAEKFALENGKDFDKQRAQLLGVDKDRLVEYETMGMLASFFGGDKKASTILGFGGKKEEIERYKEWRDKKYKPMDDLYKSLADEYKKKSFEIYGKKIDVLAMLSDPQDIEYQKKFREDFLKRAAALLGKVKLEKNPKSTEARIEEEKEKNENDSTKNAESVINQSNTEKTSKAVSEVGGADQFADELDAVSAIREDALPSIGGTQDSKVKVNSKSESNNDANSIAQTNANSAAKTAPTISTSGKSGFDDISSRSTTDIVNADIPQGESIKFDPSKSPSPVVADPKLNPDGIYITSNFGYRRNPDGSNGTSWHEGIDFGGVKEVTPVYAVKDGVVTTVEKDTGNKKTNPYGNLVSIGHSDGAHSLNAHLSKISVKEGQPVKKGDMIGVTGNTGNSFGAHLHYSVLKNGRLIDPAKWLESNGTYNGENDPLKDGKPQMAGPFYKRSFGVDKSKETLASSWESNKSSKKALASETEGEITEKGGADMNGLFRDYNKSTGRDVPSNSVAGMMKSTSSSLKHMSDNGIRIVGAKATASGKNDLVELTHDIIEISNRIYKELERHHSVAEKFFEFTQNAFTQLLQTMMNSAGFMEKFFESTGMVKPSTKDMQQMQRVIQAQKDKDRTSAFKPEAIAKGY